MSIQTKLYKGAQNENLVTDDMAGNAGTFPGIASIDLGDHDITTTPHVDTPVLECGGRDMH